MGIRTELEGGRDPIQGSSVWKGEDRVGDGQIITLKVRSCFPVPRRTVLNGVKCGFKVIHVPVFMTGKYRPWWLK